jgi:hypothetical protein
MHRIKVRAKALGTEVPPCYAREGKANTKRRAKQDNFVTAKLEATAASAIAEAEAATAAAVAEVEAATAARKRPSRLEGSWGRNTGPRRINDI